MRGDTLSRAVLGLAALLIAFTGSARAAGVSEEAVLANSCGGCHGTDGASAGAMPSIKGKKKAFIKQSLLDFRDDKKKATVMNRIAKGYNDKQIDMLADYFSAQK